MATSPAPAAILTVTALTRLIKDSLEGAFPAVWVRGEVSGCRRAESGHIYFSLKDGKDALIECVMWRLSAMRLAFEPRDGVGVEAFGGVTLYEPRGRYQLVVKELRPAGLGALLVALEELKRKLQAEGLFEASRKRPLPRYPRRIGLVTSPVGAAVRDLVKVLRGRWPSVEIVLAPTRVQGPGAALEIAGAIRRFTRYGRIDVLIVGRGGGSLEDLWAFNEEIVVRAIAASRIPVISAVGHEVDWTLADLVADVRAATPSNAAEIAVRDRVEVRHRVEILAARMHRAVHRRVDGHRKRLQALIDQYGFRRQRDAVSFIQQRIDDLADRMRNAVAGALRAARARVGQARQRYGLREWPRAMVAKRARTVELETRLTDVLVRGLHERRARTAGHIDRLRALSPRLVLERGYCLARLPDGTLVRTAHVLAVGRRISLEFARGGAGAMIESVRKGENHGE